MATVASPLAPPHRTRVPLVALLIADGVSQSGNMLTFVAIPWFVLETTGSAARTGLVAAANTLAIVVAGALGGAVVDRLRPKRATIACDLAGGSAVALIPLLHQTVGLAFWQLLVLVFLGGMLRTPGWAARQGLYAVVARRGEVALERVNAASMMIGRLAGVVGPLVGGMLIARISVASALWIDAATFLVSAGLVALGVAAPTASMTPVDAPPRAPGGSRGAAYLAEVRDGFRYIRHDGLIATLILAFALGSLLAEPLWTVVVPVYANEALGSAGALGVLFAANAVGAVVGNAAYFVWGPQLPRRAAFVAGFSVRLVSLWALAAMLPVEIIVAAIVLSAVVFEPQNPLWVTIVQERVPEELRGRVFGAYLSLSYAARSVGVFAYGLALDGIGLHATLLGMASVNAIVPLVLWLAPALRSPALPSPQGTARLTPSRPEVEPDPERRSP